jgi:hypothetical protein
MSSTKDSGAQAALALVQQPAAVPPAAAAASAQQAQAQAQFEEGRSLLSKGPAPYPRAAELLRAATDAGHAGAAAWLARG